MKMKIKDESNIEKFRRLHPRATKNLSDKEVQVLGDSITKIDNDDTPRKFKDVFQDDKGQRYMIVQDGKNESAVPLFEVKDNG